HRNSLRAVAASLVRLVHHTAIRRARRLPSFFLQRGANFREEMGNGPRPRVTRNEDHKPKTKKENQIMKNRKNILTYIVQPTQKPKIKRTTPMKQIFLYTSLAVMALAVTTTGAAPEPCDGTVQLTSQSNFQVRQAGRQTFVEFDFTGLHDICLADH